MLSPPWRKISARDSRGSFCFLGWGNLICEDNCGRREIQAERESVRKRRGRTQTEEGDLVTDGRSEETWIEVCVCCWEGGVSSRGWNLRDVKEKKKLLTWWSKEKYDYRWNRVLTGRYVCLIWRWEHKHMLSQTSSTLTTDNNNFDSLGASMEKLIQSPKTEL